MREKNELRLPGLNHDMITRQMLLVRLDLRLIIGQTVNNRDHRAVGRCKHGLTISIIILIPHPIA